MVEMSGLVEKLRKVNGGQHFVYDFYLYRDLAYCTIYGIMGLYKNFLGRPQTSVQEKFKKTISRLQIELKHGFAIH